MKSIVVAHGEAVAADRTHAASADLLVAADGGALLCRRWGLVPRLVVGDLDSLDEGSVDELRRLGSRIVRHPADKDESDTELAVRCAMDAGADQILLVAALGGPRLDHELANVLLLAAAGLQGRVSAVRGSTVVRAMHGGSRLALSGDAGDTVTLLPLAGDAHGVRTEGLRYALDGEDLPAGAARGLSNLIERPPAAIRLERGVLVVVEIKAGSA